jgi:hypothetical protein
MVKEILRGKKTPKALAAAVDLPQLNAADREYLFFQLLEGVAHGWQQPRVIKFFAKIKHRVPKSQWLDWLEAFGQQLVAETNPSEDLARRMIQLSELDCGEVTSLAGDYGHQVLSKIYGGYTEEFLPELEGSGIELGYLPEFGMGEMDLMAMDLDFDSAANLPEMQLADSLTETAPIDDSIQQGSSDLEEPIAPSSLPEASPATVPHSPISPALSNALNATAMPIREYPSYEIETNFDIPNPFQSAPPHPLEGRATNLPSGPSWDQESTLPTFGEVPAELRLSSKRSVTPPPPSPSTGLSGNLAPDETVEQIDQGEIEEHQISIEEFDMMLRSDPELLQQIAQQLGLETTDPQVVIDQVMAQMQEQIQDTSQP